MSAHAAGLHREPAGSFAWQRKDYVDISAVVARKCALLALRERRLGVVAEILGVHLVRQEIVNGAAGSSAAPGTQKRSCVPA